MSCSRMCILMFFILTLLMILSFFFSSFSFVALGFFCLFVCFVAYDLLPCYTDHGHTFLRLVRKAASYSLSTREAAIMNLQCPYSTVSFHFFLQQLSLLCCVFIRKLCLAFPNMIPSMKYPPNYIGKSTSCRYRHLHHHRSSVLLILCGQRMPLVDAIL